MGEPIDAACGSCRTCGQTVRAGVALYTADARLVCPFCYTKADIAAPPRAMFEGWRFAVIGTVANVVPLVVQETASRMVAAPSVAIAGHGWVELASGLVAALCGGATMLAARSRVSGGWLVVGVLVALLGAYHAAHGAGLW